MVAATFVMVVLWEYVFFVSLAVFSRCILVIVFSLKYGWYRSILESINLMVTLVLGAVSLLLIWLRWL